MMRNKEKNNGYSLMLETSVGSPVKPNWNLDEYIQGFFHMFIKVIFSVQHSNGQI